MKPDFLDELERQLADAVQNSGRRRFHLPRVSWRAAKLLGIGGAAVLVTSAALALVLVVSGSAGGPVRTSSPTRKLADHPRHLRPVLAAASAGAVGGATARAAEAPGSGGRSAATRHRAGTAGAFNPESFTAISEFTWWLLEHRQCGHRDCVRIVMTSDGGRRFERVKAPPTAAVDNLRFATARSGYAYGAQLWTTHDGGGRWARVRLGGPISALATSGGHVYALVKVHGVQRLMRSAIYADHWVRILRDSDPSSGSLWVQGKAVAVAAGRHVMLSNNYGDYFFTTTGRLPRHARTCDLQASANASVIWSQCETGMARNAIVRSANGGGSYSGHVTDRGPITAFGAAGPRTAVYGWRSLYRSTDGGGSWRRVQGLPRNYEWTYVGFTDATHGVALARTGIGFGYRLYHTTNAGRSYHLVKVRVA